MKGASSDISPATSYAAIVGKILQQKRVAMGMSQSEIAVALGITQGAWSRLESGSSVISLDQLHTCAAALGERPASIIELADSAESRLQDRGVKIKAARAEFDGAAVITGAALGALLAAVLIKKA